METKQIEIFFRDPVANTLVGESQYIELSDNGAMAQEIIKKLYAGPLNKSLLKTFPEEVKLLPGSQLVTNTSSLEVIFSKEYYNMTPIEELFFRTSLVWSITELEFIKDVHIFVEQEELLKINGLPLGPLNRRNMLLNPKISPRKVDSQTIKLYFLNEDKTALVPVERTIQTNPDRKLENYVIEELISGPRSVSTNATVPPETKLRGDTRTEGGICYINLSNDFIIKNTGSAELIKLNIYSIVNSLTEVSGVKKVQFLIEAEKVDNLKQSIDLSSPIERDEGYIKVEEQ